MLNVYLMGQNEVSIWEQYEAAVLSNGPSAVIEYFCWGREVKSFS